MGFESYRQGAFTKRLADLPDQPNMQAAELKTYFDSSPEELRQEMCIRDSNHTDQRCNTGRCRPAGR